MHDSVMHDSSLLLCQIPDSNFHVMPDSVMPLSVIPLSTFLLWLIPLWQIPSCSFLILKIIPDSVMPHYVMPKSVMTGSPSPSNQIFESCYPLPPKTPFSVSAWMKLDLLPRDTFLDPRLRDFPQRCIDTNDDGCRYEGQYWLHWPPPISYTNKPNFLNGFVMALSRGTKNHSSMRWTLPGEKYVAAYELRHYIVSYIFKFHKNHHGLHN